MPLIAAVLSAAPYLANLIFGDTTGTVVDKAASIIGAALGVDSTNGDAITAALAKADPSAVIAMQSALAAFAHEETMARIAAQAAKDAATQAEILTRIADVGNARTMATSLAASNPEAAAVDNRRKNFMVALDVLGILACLAFLFFLPEAGESVRTLVGMIASGFILCLRDAHTFEFGSSRGSEAKTAILAQTPAGQPPTSIAISNSQPAK